MDRETLTRRVMTERQQIFFKNETTPITIVEMTQWGALVDLPQGLKVSVGSRVQIKIGNLPAFPATVETVFEDRFAVDFAMPVNSRVVDAVNG